MKQSNSAFYIKKGGIMNRRIIKNLNLYFRLLHLNYFLIKDSEKIKIVIYKNKKNVV